MVAEFLSQREIDGVAGHLVAVRHSGIGVIACASLASAHTDDSLAYAVVEQGDIHLQRLVLIEDAGVDEVWRLTLHRSVFFFRTLFKLNLALDEGTVKRPAEILQSYESEILSDIQLHTIIVGTLCILIRINQVCAACHRVGPLDRRIEVLVEDCQRNELSTGWIPLISQVEVIDITVLQLSVSLHIAGKVEVVIHRRRYFTEFWAVNTAAIRQSHLVLVANLVCCIERWKNIICLVMTARFTLLVVTGIGDEFHIIMLEADTGVDAEFAKGERHRQVSGA